MPAYSDPLLARLEAPADDADGDSIEDARLRHAVRARLLDETVPETRIDRYVVLERLGVGGMGVVYAARDTQLDRRVAIKLVRQRHGDEPEADQRRLIPEARALAQLSHPNVIAIYDVGLHRDRVFIAMELVRGATLGRYVASETRPWQEIVRCFLQAGEGLAAAHAVGLVHRDFKPDNVLLGEDGRVRVLDFGLALGHGAATVPDGSGGRVPSSSSLTATGKIAGTPAYIAPEHYAGAPATTRSDQFSFCVAFWEALFGERPFAGTTVKEVRARMATGEITEPAQPERAPAWLRAVVARGLAADPDRRWPSMRALLEACAPRPRRGRQVGLAVAIAIAAGAATLGGWALVESRRETACDREAAELVSVWNPDTATSIDDAFVATGLGYAHATATRVGVVLDDYAQTWAQAHARGCRARLADTLDDGGWARRQSCLDDRRTRLMTLIEVLQAADRDVVNQAVRTGYELARPQACEDDARLAATAALGSAADADTIAELRRRIARAELLADTARPDALALALRTRDEATELGEPSVVAQAEIAVGAANGRLGDYRAAADAYERAYFVAAEAGADEVALVASIRLVDVVGVRLARLEDGTAWIRHAEVLLPRSGESRPWREADLAENRASVLRGQGDYAAARASYERAIELRTEFAGPDDPAVGRAWANLGTMLAENREPEAAVRALDEGERILAAAYGPDALPLAGVYNARGHLALERGDNAGYARESQRVLELREKVLGPDHPNVAAALSELATARMLLGDRDGARSLLARAIEIRRERLGAQHPALATSLNNLGVVDIHADDHPAALAHLGEALQIRRAVLPPDHPDTASTLVNLGDAMLEQHDAVRALEYYDEAATISGGDEQAAQREHVRALAGRGMANLELGRAAQARIDLEAALASPLMNDDGSAEACQLRRALVRATVATVGPVHGLREQAREAYAACLAAGADGAEFLAELAAFAGGDDGRAPG